MAPENLTPNTASRRKQRGMLGLTLPIFKSRLRHHIWKLIFLGILSLMLGVVPTLKSEIESGVLQQINNTVRSTGRELPPTPTATKRGEVFSEPLERFSGGQASGQEGIPERLAKLIFRNITLGFAILVYLLIAVVALVIELGSKAVQAAIGKDLFSRLRGEGMRRGLLTDPSDLPALQNVAGQYSMAIQQGASTVSNTYGYMLDAGQHIFALITTIVLVATKSWVFALFVLTLVLGQVVISIFQARRLANKRIELDRTRNNLMGRTDDILSKREILVAYEQQDEYAKKLDNITEEYAEIERKLEVGEQKYRGLSELLTDYGRMLTLLLALALAVYFGQSAISNIGDAYFLISIYVRIFVPASSLLMRYDSIRRSQATSKTFLDLLQLGEPDYHKETLPKTSPDWREGCDIRFSEVTFGYDPIKDARAVLNDCTFTFPAGKTTLMLGPSGSGKTTVARLLLKLWPVRSGSIEIGGYDISQISPQEVRAHMSYVSQGDHIVEDTIQENLSWSYSKNGITPERMREVLVLVGVVTPHGFDDILRVPAKELSIGQQQRLSIARMMLDESEIVIMDEPLAGVDVFTIRDLLPHLTRLLKERNHTVIMISHRLAFAGCSDHVVVLNSKGKVEEEGTPRDLFQKAGEFAALHAASVAQLNLTEIRLDAPPPNASVNVIPKSGQSTDT